LKGQGPYPGRLAHRRRFPSRPADIGNDLVAEGYAKPKPPAEVEIDRHTGKVWARKFAVAHDCGLIINPDGLRRCIEGNVVQGTSRTLSEEVAFDRARVTSTDWLSYPILDIEAPEAVDIVLLNRPELPPAGAGESSIRPVAAAVANAVFDATGVRLRRAPLTRSGSSRHWRSPDLSDRISPCEVITRRCWRLRANADKPPTPAGLEL
jgi:hypothetical protein